MGSMDPAITGDENNRALEQYEIDEEKNRIEEGEVTLDDIADVLSLTIKDDDSNKKIVFLCMLSAYTEDSQINVSLNAPSSTGKTYLASEIAKLFPKDDKIEKSGASPTSFFYGEGVMDKKRNAKIVSVERKILIFYEMPSPALQEKLRALLSKDSKELNYSFTNKDKGKNKTEDIIVQGYCATIFCSAGLRLDEQEATRAILLSPEATASKIDQAIRLQAQRSADAGQFDAKHYSHPLRMALMGRIVRIRDEKVNEILVPDHDAIRKRFLEIVGPLKPRHQRDITHLMSLVKAIALLNVWHRRDKDGRVIANQSDIEMAFKLWEDFFESQNLNVSPVVLSFYKKYVVPAYLNKFARAKTADKELWNDMRQKNVGVTSQEISTYHFETEGSAVNGEQLRKEYLPQLARAGLIAWEKPKGDGEDKRSRHVFLEVLTDDNKKYIGTYEVENMKIGKEW